MIWALQLWACVPSFPGPTDGQVGDSETGAPAATGSTGATGTTGATATTAETGRVPGDEDGDGFAAPEDCDDADPSIFPGATESCGDGIDRDCDADNPACVLDGPIALAAASAVLGNAGEGAVLASGGNAFLGRSGASIALGSSGRANSTSSEGDRVWLAAWGVSSLDVRELSFGPFSRDHSRLVSLGDLDADGVDELMAATFCYASQGSPACVYDIDASNALLLTGGIPGDVDLSSPPATTVAVDGPPGSCPGIASAGLGGGRWATAGACAVNDTGRIWILDGIPGTTPIDLDTHATTAIAGGLSTDHATGWTLASGDVVDADGVLDLLSGSYGNDTGMSALVFSGASVSAATSIADADARWSSSRDPDLFAVGTQIAVPGDVDGDGTDDVLVGMTGTPALPGTVFVMLGGSPPTGAADATAWATLEAALEPSVGSSVGGSDLDRDGVADLLLGATERNAQDGIAWLVPGAALTGPGAYDILTTASASFVGTPGSVGRLGISVLAPGDLDGDGWDDVVVGARDHGTGSAFVFLGGAL